MELYVHIVLILIKLATLFWLLWVGVELIRLNTVPPFIRTRKPIAQDLAKIIGVLPEGAIVYDPGCGDGSVLIELARRNTHARFMGIELRLWVYLKGKRRIRKEALGNIEIQRGTMFAHNFKDATHLYTYLYPGVMDTLLPKLQLELKPGTMLYSLDFPFLYKEAKEIHTLASFKQGKLGKTLYVYEF